MKLTEKHIEAEYNAYWKMCDRRDRAWDKLGKEEQDQFRMRIECTGAHPVAAAQPVDGDVVDQMLVCLYGSKCGEWLPELRDAMVRVARVPLDAMRGPVTLEECKDISGLDWKAVTAQLINLRIERILNPKKQTPEERVRQFLLSISLIDLRDPAYLDAATTDLLSLIAALKEMKA